MVKEKVLDLANKISRVKRGSKYGITEKDPEYRIIEAVLTDEMAETALCLNLKDPKTTEEVAELCGKSIELTETHLLKMADDGVIGFSRDEEGGDRFFLELWVPGVMEMMVVHKENVAKYPQIAECFEEYSRVRGGMFAGNIPVGLGLMRVIPVESSIEGETRKASYEEVSKYLNENEVFSVADCACRTVRESMGEGCGHPAEEMCIQLGEAAEYYIRTGRGREITREEAFEIILKAEKEGLIHQIPNTEGPGKTHAICNCCGCSCLSLRHANMFKSSDTVRSNYVSQVDAKKCVACGECVENCHVNALTLGPNICSLLPEKEAEKKQAEIRKKEKQRELPSFTEWGPDKWDPDFRNRTFVAEEGTSPCKSECPAHIAVQGYIKMASQGRYREALELIKKENPFPAICGRICPRKCESVCTRGDIDESLAIDEIKKFIADQELNSSHRFVPDRKDPNHKKIAVIGGGPAGLSCAYYLAVDGYEVTVFEKQKIPGGMLTLGIPSYRLGREIINAEISILRELGIRFRTETEVGKDVTLNELREEGFLAFYLAIGAQTGRSLGLEGEEAEGVLTGIDFLRQVNLNDTMKLEGSAVVIGGGNVSIDVARTAVRTGASRVDMFCLESRNEMPALEEEIDEALSENVVINNSWGPQRILVEKGRVAGVLFKKCLSVFDEKGLFSPVFDENETRIVRAENVLLSVGQGMDWGNLLLDSKIRLNSNNTVQADSLTFQTGEPDVFAGGDALTGPRFAIDAIALGKKGAVSVHRYVNGYNLTINRVREFHSLDKDSLNLENYDRLPRQRPLDVDGRQSRETFNDLRSTFTEEQMKKETERCIGCGAVVSDPFQCVGCGVCTTKCKFDAIILVRKYNDGGVELSEMRPAIMRYMVKRKIKIAAHKVKKMVFSR